MKTTKKRKKIGVMLLDEPIEIVDPYTGETRKASRMLIPYGYKDSFFAKVYYGTIKKLADLPKSAQKLLDWCIENMDRENKVYILNQKKLAEELGFKYGTVRNAISKLIKLNFLKKLENGLYMVNPSLAVKVEDPRDLYVQFVDSEEFEDFIEKVAENQKKEREEDRELEF